MIYIDGYSKTKMGIHAIDKWVYISNNFEYPKKEYDGYSRLASLGHMLMQS